MSIVDDKCIPNQGRIMKMSIIICPECKKEISDKANICIHCGFPRTNEVVQLANDEALIIGIKEDIARKARIISRRKEHQRIKKLQDTNQKWKSLGYGDYSLRFISVALSCEEVDELFSLGLISSQIYSIFDGEFSIDSGHDKYEVDYFAKKAKDAGVRLIIDIPNREEVILFLDSYMIVGYIKESWHRRAGSEKTIYTYEMVKDRLLVIPYSKITNFSVSSVNYSGGWQGKTIEKQGNVLAGAVIGGAIGGTTGAVIGASAALTPKKEVIIRPGTYNDDVYRIKIEILGGWPIEEDLFSVSNKYPVIDYRFSWTYTINNFLLENGIKGKRLTARSDADQICNQYLETFNIIRNKARFTEKKYGVIKALAGFTDGIIANNVITDDSFIAYVYDISTHCNAAFFRIIEEKLRIVAEEVRKKQNLNNDVFNKINVLENERDGLSLFSIRRRKEIQCQIEELKKSIEIDNNDRGEIIDFIYECVTSNILKNSIPQENIATSSMVTKRELVEVICNVLSAKESRTVIPPDNDGINSFVLENLISISQIVDTEIEQYSNKVKYDDVILFLYHEIEIQEKRERLNRMRNR